MNKPPQKSTVKITNYLSGKLKFKDVYVSGKKHGMAGGWYESGAKWYETICNNDKRHGMETYWHENGQKYKEEKWRDGEKHGVSRQWWDNGKNKMARMWEEKERHGMETYWYNSGKKKYEAYYLRGRVYAMIGWDEKGNVSESYNSLILDLRTPPQQSQKIISSHK